MQDANYRKKFGLDEMMIHIPMCSHKDIKKVLIVGKVSDDFKNEIAKHECKDITYKENIQDCDEQFDIIIYTKSTPNQLEMANINRSLEPTKGILVAPSVFVYKNIEQVKKDILTIGKDFWICMPYSFGHNTLIFASKKYHPQAEIVLQVSDLLEDCQYYNTELHNAVFIHPTYITKELTTIAKR
jgi:spermidine synthase